MSGKRYLPAIEHIEIRDLTLYRNKPMVDVAVRPGVFCLAGANGMGKSSFLAAVSFGLTGIVAEPGRKFTSAPDYYRDCLQFSSKFFTGRVDDLHRQTAEVMLRFKVGRYRYQISRNLFEPQSLNYLSICDENGNETAEHSEDARERHSIYASRVAADCHLGSFDQFVFLQHFVLTFDERRELLFWNSSAISPALYLAFDVNANDEIRASELESLISKSDSNARNAQWQATNARKRLQELGGDENEDEDYLNLLEEHKQLAASVEATARVLTDVQKEESDARLRLAEVSALQQELRAKYDAEFANRLIDHVDVRMHPTVRSTLSTGQCVVCGTAGSSISQTLEARISAHQCPLCSSGLAPNEPSGASMTKLKELDERLSSNQAKIDGLQARVDRLTDEAQSAAHTFQDARERLEAFERENNSLTLRPTPDGSSLAEQRHVIEREREAALIRRDEARARRDAYREELGPLQASLTRAYNDAELQFVPKFRDLAKRFLGLDLDIFLESASPTTKHALALEVQGERRRRTTALSESQRFFLDIALRMALVQHMTQPDSRATVYVDTPEGSLDIAYEARAGSMFGQFAMQGFNLIMTANINASQLLVRLANVCTDEGMQLVRMTDWAPLTEVQADEEDLFDRAYSAIEDALTTALGVGAANR